MSKCTKCKGSGFTSYREGEFFDLEFIPPCSHCDGTGQEPEQVLEKPKPKKVGLLEAVLCALASLAFISFLVYIAGR